jgi:signal transduction histidine kinase
MNIGKSLLAQSKLLTFFEGLLMCCAIGYVDYRTDWSLSLAAFYALPISFVAWFGGRNAAVLLAFLSGMISYQANFATQPFPTLHTYLLSVFNRTFFLTCIAIGTSAMRRYREEYRARIEVMQHSRELEQEILRTSERERLRIGQDLHDGLCQNLVAIDCAAQCLKADLEARALPEAATAAIIQRLLKEAVTEARSLARGIFPAQLTGDGLPVALEDLASNVSQLRHVAVKVETPDFVRDVSPEVALHLYRITQEALSNAVKHARANQIVVGLTEEPGRLILKIADDGRGFIPAESNSDGLGLKTMRYRAESNGGDFTIESQLERGTTIRCTVPIAYAATH